MALILSLPEVFVSVSIPSSLSKHLSRTLKGLRFLTDLQSSKLSAMKWRQSFVDAGRWQKTPESNTKDFISPDSISNQSIWIFAYFTGIPILPGRQEEG